LEIAGLNKSSANHCIRSECFSVNTKSESAAVRWYRSELCKLFTFIIAMLCPGWELCNFRGKTIWPPPFLFFF